MTLVFKDRKGFMQSIQWGPTTPPKIFRWPVQQSLALQFRDHEYYEALPLDLKLSEVLFQLKKKLASDVFLYEESL